VCHTNMEVSFQSSRSTKQGEFHTIKRESISSLQNPRGGVSGYCPVEAPRPLSYKYKEKAS
jgi:hypothetical protein